MKSLNNTEPDQRPTMQNIEDLSGYTFLLSASMNHCAQVQRRKVNEIQQCQCQLHFPTYKRLNDLWQLLWIIFSVLF